VPAGAGTTTTKAVDTGVQPDPALQPSEDTATPAAAAPAGPPLGPVTPAAPLTPEAPSAPLPTPSSAPLLGMSGGGMSGGGTDKGGSGMGAAVFATPVELSQADDAAARTGEVAGSTTTTAADPATRPD
jgi:hypothetical protein